LQANGLAAHVASFLISSLPPLARLSLCGEIDIATIQQTLEAEHEDLVARKAWITERPAVGQAQSPSNSAALGLTTVMNVAVTAAGSWFITAFQDLVLNFRVKLPLTDDEWTVDETVRWHVAIARESILKARCTKTNIWIERHSTYEIGALTVFAVYNLRLSERSEMKHSLEKAPGTCRCIHDLYRAERDTVSNGDVWGPESDDLMKALVPTDQDERKAIVKYCNSANLI